MSSTRTILVTAASGNIGSKLIPLLLSQNPPPTLVLPTRKAQKLKTTLPEISKAGANVIIPEGTVQDPIWFESILRDQHVDTVFLCLTGSDELYSSLNGLDAITRAGTVKTVIFLSIIGDFTSEQGFKETMRTRAYPHLFAKVLVENRLLNADYSFEWTVLGPTLFFTNDNFMKAGIMQKGETSSLSKHGVNKISLSDIALAVWNVAYDTTGAWNRKKIQLGTKQLFDGAETTKLWSEALGKPLKPGYATKEAMTQVELYMRAAYSSSVEGMQMARSRRIVHEYLEEYGMSMTESEYEEQVKLLGKEPDSYELFIKETAQKWLSEESAA